MKFRLIHYRSNYYVAQVKSLLGWVNITSSTENGILDERSNYIPGRDHPLLFKESELKSAKILLTSWYYDNSLYIKYQKDQNELYENLMKIYNSKKYPPKVIDIPSLIPVVLSPKK